jgi:hypothetical protein
MRLITSFLLLIALSACTSSLTQLRTSNPGADHFSDALASEYLAYANSEEEQGRHSAAEYYADKGLRALKGENVEPEKADLSLPENEKLDLANARKQLVNLTTDDMKRVAPQKLARAQALFDCWRHQLSKRIDQESAPCSDEFKSTFEDVQRIASVFAGVERVDTIDFAPKSTSLNDDAVDTIKEMAEAAKGDSSIIRLEGRAKRDGLLLQRRMHVITLALEKEGVAFSRVKFKEKTGSSPVRLSNDVAPISADQVRITLEPVPVKAVKAKEHS